MKEEDFIKWFEKLNKNDREIIIEALAPFISPDEGALNVPSSQCNE